MQLWCKVYLIILCFCIPRARVWKHSKYIFLNHLRCQKYRKPQISRKNLTNVIKRKETIRFSSVSLEVATFKDDIKEMAINKCKFVHFYVPYIFPLNTDKIGNRYFKFKILNFCGLSCTKIGEMTFSAHPLPTHLTASRPNFSYGHTDNDCK